MPSPNPKTTTAISPGVAAQQAEWHCRQAADHFGESTKPYGGPQARGSNRRRFIENANLALPSMGLEAFLTCFHRQLRERQDWEQAEPIIRELWAELTAKEAIGEQAAAPVPAKNGAKVALKTAQRLLAIASQQVEAALALVREPGEMAEGSGK